VLLHLRQLQELLLLHHELLALGGRELLLLLLLELLRQGSLAAPALQALLLLPLLLLQQLLHLHLLHLHLHLLAGLHAAAHEHKWRREELLLLELRPVCVLDACCCRGAHGKAPAGVSAAGAAGRGRRRGATAGQKASAGHHHAREGRVEKGLRVPLLLLLLLLLQ
jgi:hypothetical protein